MANVNLFAYQKEAVKKLDSGSILCGGVGCGKSITSLAYFYEKECGGVMGVDGKLSPPKNPKDLYVITTARKRDTHEWEAECEKFSIFSDPSKSVCGIRLTVDSWNNVHKYVGISGAMFIFDEQRVVGSGVWVKSFTKISRSNRWILLTATPGDTWLDYIPVFVANGFYKNRSAFLLRHAVYNRYARYPKIDSFKEVGHLESLRRKITVLMDYKRSTIHHYDDIQASYNKELFRKVSVDRWNPFDNCPIKEIGEVCYLMRRVANSDDSRYKLVLDLLKSHPRMIIFYNFDYELEILKKLSNYYVLAEWNGHRHNPVPHGESWVYLVQYTAGAEAWNCIETDTILFYSQNYSYKLMTQAAGRIDRLNTPYRDLYYYTFKSKSPIDIGIEETLKNKQDFNELDFLKNSIFA